MKTIAISLPYGVNLRNFFLTEWAVELCSEPDVRVICLTGVEGANAPVAAIAKGQVVFERLDFTEPSAAERGLDAFQRLAFLPFSDYLTYCSEDILRSHLWLRWGMAAVWKTGIYRRRWFLSLLQAARRLFYRPTYAELFRRERIDLAVATRLFNTDEWRFLEAARRAGVKTAVVISSWDNLHSYGYMPIRPDRVVVWNDVMRNEAVEKHGIAVAAVDVVGPPQFDLYGRPADLPRREEYFARIGADPTKRLISFTTADILSDQPRMAELIHATVIAGHADRQLLVRVHPQEDPTPYRTLSELLPAVILDIPGKAVAGAADRLFSRQDFADLAFLMTYSDAVINVCSTITLDASAADTPVICYRSLTAYSNKNRMQRIIRAHDNTHFAPLLAVGGVLIAEDEPSLSRIVSAALADRTYERQRRMAVRALMVPYADGAMAHRLARKLLEMVSRSLKFTPPPSAKYL